MNYSSKNLYQIADIYALESSLYQQGEATPEQLMQRAGEAAFNYLRQRWPNARSVLILCGNGNNGGDGFVLARLAHQQGLKVKVRYLGMIEYLPEPALTMAKSCINSAMMDVAPFEITEQDSSEIIVDALLGIGLKGEIRPDYLHAIQWVNFQNKPVLSLDIPSGINADTGAVITQAVIANKTICFLGLKRGLFTGSAVNHTGEILLNHLEIPQNILEQFPAHAQLIEFEPLLNKYLAKRKKDVHKGSFGHVLVIGGNYGMSGAVRMAAEAAARVGAGLVSIATRSEHVSAISASRPELICHGIDEPKDINSLLDKTSIIVIGPGLGVDSWAQSLLNEVLSSSLPKLFDADALNLISQKAFKRNDWVLTPHPGEAARLLSVSIQEIQHNRFAAAKEISRRYGGVCVLKGAGSIVVKADEANIKLCAYGNPGMASGGMGDILSGVIGGLIAQGVPSFIAAQIGVVAHAMAGDRIAQREGERGMLALDLLLEIRSILNNK